MTYSDAEIRRMLAYPTEKSRWFEWCAQRGHPGTTFNPLYGLTWCACGLVVVEGDTATHDLCCEEQSRGHETYDPHRETGQQADDDSVAPEWTI